MREQFDSHKYNKQIEAPTVRNVVRAQAHIHCHARSPLLLVWTAEAGVFEADTTEISSLVSEQNMVTISRLPQLHRSKEETTTTTITRL